METSIQNGQVVFVDGADRFTVTLHKTLRLPEDGNTHNLPPNLGSFPIKRVEDYKDKVPQEWLKHGGVFFPMWQREAMWLSFNSARRPFACKVAAGKVNAVSGKTWSKELAPSDTSDSGDPRQDYIVAPPQPWLDGFNSGNGVIKQFVAMPLGMGYTVEGQVTGKEEFGGIQIMAIPPKPGLLEPKPREYSGSIMRSKGFVGGGGGGSWGGGCSTSGVYSASVGASYSGGVDYACNSINEMSLEDAMRKRPGMYGDLLSAVLPQAAEMGLAAGGSMVQKIYPDTYGLDTWDVDASGRMYIHIVNSEMYEQITGEKPPKSPITAQTYAQYGYPWYSVWDKEMGDVGPSKTLAGVKTISQKDQEKGFVGQQNDSTLKSGHLLVSTVPWPHVKDGTW